MPKPNINFEHLACLNSERPQTSYGGISERKKSLQKNKRQQSSKLCDRINFNDKNFIVGNIYDNNDYNYNNNNNLNKALLVFTNEKYINNNNNLN